MLFREWHLDYRGALFTITVNTSFFTIALRSLCSAALRIKEVFQHRCGFWGYRVYCVGILSPGFRRETLALHFNTRVYLFWLQRMITIIISIIMMRHAAPELLLHADRRMFLLRTVIWNIHPTALSKCNPRQLSLQHPPPPDFIPSISCIDTDQHIPNIRGITYCPCDTLQMHLRLMIYRGRGSTKTISKPDTLTSDFKKFPSNLFDLWKCVQVHREWFQIYHILVRIINDFQFVNLRLPCSEELRRITKGGYQSPCFAPEAWLLYQNIATYDLHFTYFPLLQSLSRCLHFSPLSAMHIFQKRLPNTRAATAYVIAWLIFWS